MKKYLSVIACLVVLLLFCCSIVLLSQTSVPNYMTANTKNISSLPTVIIDPGHGDFDCGATSIDGNPEKDYNLAISLILADWLKMNGYNVVLTRSNDTGTQDPDAVTLREKKVSDIHNRMNVMNSTENCIFVSIHQNFYSDKSCHGAQVFYSGNNDESKVLAEYIQKSIAVLAEPDNTRVIKKSDKSIYLLHNATKPAVLVECGFISNLNDSKKLADPEYQKKLCLAIGEAIYNYTYSSEE